MKGKYSLDRARVTREVYVVERPPRRPLRTLLYRLLVLLVVVAVLPTVVSRTPLRNMLLTAAMPSDAVHATVAGASLGWLSTPAVSGLEVRDAAGQLLASAESIHIGRSPWALATNWRDLGQIEIVRPTLYLAIRPDGTNLEDALAALLPTGQPASTGGVPASPTADSKPLQFAVRVTEGTVLAQEANTARRWRLYNVNAQFTTDASGGIGALTVSGQMDDGANSAAGPIPPGRFALSLNTTADGRQQLQWQAESMALAVAEPWLRRYARGAELGGTLSGQGTANWAAARGAVPQAPVVDLRTAGVVRIEQLEATLPMLAGDRIRLAKAELPWQIASSPAGLTIDELDLRSDLGRVAARGTVDPTALAGAGGLAAVFDAAGRNQVEFRGEIDLAKLAAMLPRLLRIRSDTTITGGTLQVQARNRMLDDEQSITGTVRTVGLSATSAGRPLQWEQPVSAAFDLRRRDDAVRLESLRCDSEFLRITAAGTAQQLTADAQFDLNQLATQLSQFVDLSGIELAGSGTAHLDWLLSGQEQFTASANTDLAQLRVGLADGKVWAEPRLAAKAQTAGTLDPASRQPAQVVTARLELDADGDRLDAQLMAPVDTNSAATTWPVAIRATGDVARWLARARPWFSPEPWHVDGQSNLAADVRVTTATAAAPIAATTIDVANGKLSVSNLRVTGIGWSIAEPRVELAGDFHWNSATGEAASRSAQLVSSSVSLAAQNVQVKRDGQSPSHVSGVAAFRADLARLAAWRAPAARPPRFQPRGMVSGNLRFAQEADRLTSEFNATGENLSLVQAASRGVPAPGLHTLPRGEGPPASPDAAPQTIWQEPRVVLRGVSHYEPSADRIAFEQFELQSNTLQAAAQGVVERLTTTADTNAAGTLNYDLAQLTLLLRPYVGDGVQLVGRETARFQVAGPLFAQSQLKGRVEAPWQSASVYGLPFGPGRVAATLGEGVVRFDPLAVAVAEGKLTATPLVRLAPEPMELTLPAGPLLTDVLISPAVSEAMLKYIAPVLAGATQSEGHFTLELDGARVPLAEPRRADVGGRLDVHSVRVVPGPMARQWVELAQQIEAIARRRDLASLAQRPPATLLAIQDQQVNFRVVDGRVYHQGMQFQVGDVVLRSEGSVGFDESLAILLHVPIQDQWIEGQSLLVGLRGQTLKIPISGTLRQPRMDQSAVAGLSQQLLQGAAQQAIGNELNKAFDKLLKPR